MSQSHHTVFRGVTAVLPDGARPVDVCVADGIVAAVLAPGTAPAAARDIDCDGLFLLPGLIDTHMHVQGPTFDYREDFTTGSASAAAGGVTTMFEMPLARPTTHCVEVLRDRIADAQKKGLINIAFYGAAGHENVEHIVPLAKAGVIGYKTFTQYPAKGRELDFQGLCTPTSADLYRVCLEVAKTGRVLAVHADTDSLIAMFQTDPSFGQDGGPIYGRPPVVEMEATARAVAVAWDTGVKLSICHASLPAAVELIETAKRAGQDFSVESCLGYLLLSQADANKFGAYAKIKPPLRIEDIRAKMWDLFAEGRIDFLGSDHAPYTDEEKNAPVASYGMAGVEMTLPMLLLGVAEGKFGLTHLARICSENPARRFDLFPRKGRIAVGADADLVLVDLAQKETVRLDRLQTKCKNCARAFEGRQTGGAVRMTMVAGEPVYENGEITAAAGSGRIVYPNGIEGR